MLQLKNCNLMSYKYLYIFKLVFSKLRQHNTINNLDLRKHSQSAKAFFTTFYNYFSCVLQPKGFYPV